MSERANKKQDWFRELPEHDIRYIAGAFLSEPVSTELKNWSCYFDGESHRVENKSKTLIFKLMLDKSSILWVITEQEIADSVSKRFSTQVDNLFDAFGRAFK